MSSPKRPLGRKAPNLIGTKPSLIGAKPWPHGQGFCRSCPIGRRPGAAFYASSKLRRARRFCSHSTAERAVAMTMAETAVVSVPSA